MVQKNHGVATDHLLAVPIALLMAAAAAVAIAADRPSPGGIDRQAAAQTYRHVSDSLTAAPIIEGQSPYLPDGRTVSGETGVPIPCLCMFRGTSFKVGETVCMATHLGTVMTRCELVLNNTSWTPTDVPCTVSRAPMSRRNDVAGLRPRDAPAGPVAE